MEERYTDSHEELEKPALVKGLAEMAENLKAGSAFDELKTAVVEKAREILCQEVITDDDIAEVHDLFAELAVIMRPRHFKALKKL